MVCKQRIPKDMPRLSNPFDSFKEFLYPDKVLPLMKELNDIGGGKMPPIVFSGPFIDNARPLIIASTPAVLKEVSDDVKFPKLRLIYDSIGIFIGDGLVSSSGERWRTHRTNLNPLFLHNHIKRFSEEMVKNGTKMVEEIKRREGEAINVPELLSVVTEKVLIDSLFSGKIDPTKCAQLFLEGMQHFNNFILFEMVVGHTINKLLPFSKHVSAARQKLKQIIQPLIDEARLESHALDEHERDLIQTMVSTVNPDGTPVFNDTDIFEESLTMLFAGHDTTKNSLSWSVYYLAKYPNELKKVQEEVKEVLKGNAPTFDDIPKLRCCKNVIQESLRIRAPVPQMERIAAEDCYLNGFFVPKGTTLWLNFAGALTDAGVWEKPFEFNPDRFNNETNYSKSFVPFSLGNRNCIGQKFAISEGILLLACLVQHFSFEMACEKVESRLEGTLTPKGLCCKFVRP